MKNLILFDSEVRDHLLPLTFTRPVCELRVGILTIREKWERWLTGKAAYITQEYLGDKYPFSISEQNYLINGSVMPTEALCRRIEELGANEALLQGDELIVAKLDDLQLTRLMEEDAAIDEMEGRLIEEGLVRKINRLPDIFKLNGIELESDFNLLTAERESAPLSPSNHIFGEYPIFLEPGARVEGAMLNASEGPIYIGANAEVMEGSLIRGSFALCEHGVVRMGAKVYGATTVGPWSKIGGEVSNTVIQAYSNKAHDGYLGNSVIGEWCNIGADTNNSNLKNNYTDVRIWSYVSERFEPTGELFCGLIMGDHSKCGINTMFNTATVVGVASNVYGQGFPRTFIPSFSWGGASGFKTHQPDKAFETADVVMGRRQKMLNTEDRLILLRIFEDTAKYRKWEK